MNSSVYSSGTLTLLRRERRRFLIRRWRQATLLLVLLVISGWAYSNYRADNFTFAWSRPVRVLVLAVIDPRTPFTSDARQGFLQRFLSSPVPGPGNLAGVERWFRDEYRRHTGRSDPPIEFTARGPARAGTAPPLPPSSDAPFYERWRGTRAFLRYFEGLGKKEGLISEAYDVTLFVYFFDEDEISRYARQHSVASRRNRRGVVFSPLGPNHIDRAAALLAHELCHTLGASDKYEGHESVFPDGFADPERRPAHPQDQAEIMALGIPIAPGRERRVEEIGECVVGRKTAGEIGWRP